MIPTRDSFRGSPVQMHNRSSASLHDYSTIYILQVEISDREDPFPPVSLNEERVDQDVNS